MRQGDPLSPLLFNLVSDALASMLDGVKAIGHIHGVAQRVIPGGLMHLQYADDTFILIRNDPMDIVSLKFLLMCFEAMSGLKINFEKSDIIVMGCDLEAQLRSTHMMNGRLRAIPMTYPGLPISDYGLRIADFAPIADKVAGSVEPWQGKYLSSGGKLALINVCLTNAPMYAMGFYLLQDGVHDKFDKVRSRFFW